MVQVLPFCCKKNRSRKIIPKCIVPAFLYLMVFLAPLFPFNSIAAQTTDTRIVPIHSDTSLVAQITDFDKIVTRKWKQYVVKIQHIDPINITYTFPLNNEPMTIAKSEVAQIFYADGRKDIFVTPDEDEMEDNQGIDVRELDAWEKIVVLESDSSLAGLEFIEHIDIRYEGNKLNMNNEKLERNALIILRKKAANREGTHMYVTGKQANRAYGELPYMDMEADVYRKVE